MLVPKLNFLCRRISFFLPLRLGFHSSSTSVQSNYLNRQLDLFFSNPISDFESLLQSHSFIYTTGHSNNIFFAAKLISLYSSFNKPNFGAQVFESIHPKDTFLWNSIVKCYFSNGEYSQALKLYGRMVVSDAAPNHFTIPMAVAACAELGSLPRAKNIHGLTVKLSLFAGNPAAGSSFVYMYAKCGEMEDASLMFDEMPLRDVVAWTALVIGYVQNNDCEKGLFCLKEMLVIGEDGVKPNWRTIEGGLQACGNLGALLEGRCLHCYALKTGIVSSQVIESTLLCMYSKCGTNEEALLAFSEVPDKDLISWTSIISAYAKGGNISECVELFWEMWAADIDPDGIVIGSMLSGFGNSMMVHAGKAFHGLIVRRNFELDHMINHSLLSMYCKFGCIYIAERLFNRVCQRDSESWNWMVSGYSRIGLDSKCLELFREMQHLGFRSNINSLGSVISSCSKLGATLLGRSVHCYVIKVQIDEDVSTANSLVDMYGKFRNLNTAQNIFSRTPKDLVTWNTLISAYTRNGHSSEAVTLFDMMILEDLKPNSATLVTVLSACSHLGALKHGERVHCYIKERGFDCDLRLSTALVDMYGKCGQLAISREIFDAMPERDVVSWNVIISGYGIHGDAKSAIEIFQQMEESSVEPNGLTFLAILSACAHAGLVEEGKYLFGRMRDYGVLPTLKHYACIVDLLGRSGDLCEAESMILSMPILPDGGVWGALLSACIIHNNLEMGERIAKRAIELDPENDGYYILISNMYNSTGKWEDAERMREMMKSRGVRKRAGWSAV
ncbi:pentatricopeptide repeat-containing protein At4g39952, mitochondrial [Macadamia integrifolia]|uniref:pentatricopeptide repeat-containing protein At4g39952, mitochondrial n=1 Tax=Macadamia integrifolia TaxID=60698 RepID=UPI001C4EA391|nr:pentatricopeptide repeat-containing protein At4g39952, mitochondrial [Macadamia integrifolia]